MEVNWITIFVAVVAASPGLIAGLVALRRGRADVAKVSSEVYTAVIEELKEERKELLDKVDNLASRLQLAENDNATLNSRLKLLGAEVAELRFENKRLKKENGELKEVNKIDQDIINNQLLPKMDALQKRVKQLEKRDTGPLKE